MKEEIIHRHICQYLKAQYPNVIFNTDLSGIKLTIGQAKKIKSLRSSRAWPDLFICEPRGKYAGLFIELKNEAVKIEKKNGQIVSDSHIQEQAEMLRELSKRGYYCDFACGFDDAKRLIDEYLNIK